jgi:carbonic anhydrase/acetyltransferase-like protein (isoleucine patch superfamily)
MLLLLNAALFVLVLALPAIPSMFERARPEDDGRLPIAEAYVRDARWFGRTFRRKLAPFVAAARRHGPSVGAMHMRTAEDVRWSPDLHISPRQRLRGIDVGDRVVVGHGAGIRDAYGLERVDVEPDVVARTLTSDALMHLGERVRVLRWVDADGELTVEAESDLGVSASGGARVLLRGRVRFERVWGAPVATATAGTEVWRAADRADLTSLTLADAAAQPSMIARGPVRLTSGTEIREHLKVHGDVVLEPGCRIGGNLIARGDVTILAGAVVAGHIFAEGTVRLGPGTRISCAGIAKTVYATGEVVLADDVSIFGWVVAERGGRTL